MDLWKLLSGWGVCVTVNKITCRGNNVTRAFVHKSNSRWRPPAFWFSMEAIRCLAIAYSLLMFTVSLLICKLVDFFSCSEYDWARKNPSLFEFLLSVIELLFLYLTVEALQGKMCQNSLLSGGGRSLGAKISWGRGRPPANILIPLERQLIRLQFCCWEFLYNETLQQTFRPLLSKLSKRRQI